MAVIFQISAAGLVALIGCLRGAARSIGSKCRTRLASCQFAIGLTVVQQCCSRFKIDCWLFYLLTNRARCFKLHGSCCALPPKPPRSGIAKAIASQGLRIRRCSWKVWAARARFYTEFSVESRPGNRGGFSRFWAGGSTSVACGAVAQGSTARPFDSARGHDWSDRCI
jgi:hypothetical protein